MIEKKLEFVEDVLKDVLNYIADDAECICDETTLEYAKEQMDKLDKAINAMKELKASHLVDSYQCLVVSPEDFEMRGYLTYDKSEEDLQSLACSVAHDINDNELIMECFWDHLDHVAEEEGMLRYCGEKYALCSVTYKDEPGKSFEAYIKMNNEPDGLDDRIFFYCNGVENLESLTDKDNGEDFYVNEIIEFANEIN